MTDGCKLKPFVVFKGMWQIAKLNQVLGVVVCLSCNGWTDEALTLNWTDSVWGQVSFQRCLLRCLLMWDALRWSNNSMTKWHTPVLLEKPKNHVSKLKTDMCRIPGGLTTQLQPRTSLSRPLAERELYNEWMVPRTKQYTTVGNVKPPDKLLFI